MSGSLIKRYQCLSAKTRLNVFYSIEKRQPKLNIISSGNTVEYIVE